jgi:hypothetical protein
LAEAIGLRRLIKIHFFREEKTSSDTFVCQTTPNLNCSNSPDESESTELGNIGKLQEDQQEEEMVCHPNIVSLCQTKPEIVTVTEQRQMCGTPKV